MENVVLLHCAGFFAGPDINYAQRLLREDIPGIDLHNFAQQLDRFLGAILFCIDQDRQVDALHTLRALTPGPSPSGRGEYGSRPRRDRMSALPASCRLIHELSSGCYGAGLNDRFGEALHLFELRAALQQQEIDSGGFEFRDAVGDLLGRAD